MSNPVKIALRRLGAANSFETGEQQFEKLAEVVAQNVSDALAAYKTTKKYKTQLVWCLQGITKPAVLPVLEDALHSKEKYLRWAALEALKHYKGKEVLPLFTAAAKDRSPMVRNVALSWLKENRALVKP